MAELNNGHDNSTYQTAEAGEDPTATSNPALVILDGFYSLLPAATTINAGTGPTPAAGTESYIGAVIATDDWTADWTYGLHAANRGQALWFE